LSIGVGAQSDEGLADGDAELGGDHPGGLVDLGAVPRQVRRLPIWPGARHHGRPVEVLAFEQDNGRGIGEDQRIAQLGCAQRTRLVPVQAKGADMDGPDLQRQREDRYSAGLPGLRREARPAAAGV
jgi:hypothetical protein